MKTAKTHLYFGTKAQNFNRDDSKTLFDHCLLHLISLRGLDVKTNPRDWIGNLLTPPSQPGGICDVTNILFLFR